MTAFSPEPHLLNLGFSPFSKPKASELKKARNDLLIEHHPDKGGDPEEFQKVTHSYKMLTNPKYRADDAKKEAQENGSNTKGDLNISIQAPISFEDAFFGRKAVLSFAPNELDEDFEYMEAEEVEIYTISVDIPPGSTEGYNHIARGKGNKMRDARGDASLSFIPKPHPKFTVMGSSVNSRESIPLHLLLKGGEIDIQTMYGIKSLTVPPGTEPGTVLEIRNCGLLEQGHHYVNVTPIFPSKKELKTDNWKGLDIDWGDEEEEEEGEGTHLLYGSPLSAFKSFFGGYDESRRRS